MQDKASGTNAYMTVKEMGTLLGLKKVDSYWLVLCCRENVDRKRFI